MKVLTVVIVLCVGATLTSSSVHVPEIYVPEEWWNSEYFVKFNSPSGETFYIDTTDGTINRGKREIIESKTEVPLIVDKKLPFISFVSLSFKIYDIQFEYDGINSHSPRLVESEFVNHNLKIFNRPRLEFFVGPNKKLYQVIYNDGDAVNITEKSSEALDHFQIKTLGPYEKWEHTYDFSENGGLVEDHTISPIPVLADRSILLPEVEPDKKNLIGTFLQFNSPSGVKYAITSGLDIVTILDDGVDETAYITFTEPNGRSYVIHIDKEDGRASLVAKSVDENYFRSDERLYSFVAPNGILYRIDHKNESDHEVPVLVSNSSDPSNSQTTLLELARYDHYYNTYVKYIFSDNGKKLFDRVEEVDWTPLNELPALPAEEVTADYVLTNSPFLTLYTPSGNNYHIFTNATNASIAVEKGARQSQGLYISYLLAGKSKTNIHFVPGAHPYFEEDAKPVKYEDLYSIPSFELSAFSTPDQKEYTILSPEKGVDEWKPSIRLNEQVKEPIKLIPVSALTIEIVHRPERVRYHYRFTWNGDKLIEASFKEPIPIDGRLKIFFSLVGK